MFSVIFCIIVIILAETFASTFAAVAFVTGYVVYSISLIEDRLDALEAKKEST